MPNVYTLFRKLLPQTPLQIGDVTAYSGGVATIELPDGGVVTARGAASVGQRVFFRDGTIESVAPTLDYVEIDV